MSCKFNNSMYITIPKETGDFEWFDIDELVEEPVEDIDHDFIEQEVEEFNHLQFLISEYHDSDE